MSTNVWRALVRKEPRGTFRRGLPLILVAAGAMVALHACSAQAQDRIIGRDGRTQGYVDRLPGSTDQYRIIGRDGRTQGYVDGSSGRITGRDGLARGYLDRPPARDSREPRRER